MHPESFFSKKDPIIAKGKSLNTLRFSLPILFTVLLVFLKLPLLQVYVETVYFFLTFAPMLAIGAVSFYAFYRHQKGEPTNRLKYYLLMLEILSAIFIFYLIYAPQEFLSFLRALTSFSQTFISKEILIILAGPVAILIFLAFLLIFLIRLIQNKKEAYPHTLNRVFKKLSYSLFFILLFLGSGVVWASPESVKPLTDSLGDAIFTLSSGNIQVLKGTDISQYKKLSSLKELTSNLSSSLQDTSRNITETLEENKTSFQAKLSKSTQELTASITDTTSDLKEKLTEDIEERLSLSGGTILGELTINDDLTIKGLSELRGTLTATDILPDETGTYDLGSSSKGWDNLFVSRIQGSSPVIIGNGASNLSLSDSGDLVVSRQLEVLSSTNLQNLTISGELTLPAGSIINDYINSITSDKISDIIPILRGGIGAATANAGLNNLLPVQTANSNKFLQTDGTNSSWQDVLLSDLKDPETDLNLSLDGTTAEFNFTASDTGSGSLFTLSDTDNNLGDGYLLNLSTGESSWLNPLKISVDNGSLTAISVDNLGRVGIGTDEINNNLSVLGDFDLIGNLGIGIDNPLAPLHIDSTDDPQFKISNLAETFDLQLDFSGNVLFSISGDSYTFDKKVIADTLETDSITANNVTTYAQGDGRVGDAYCQKKEVSTAGVVGDWVNINNDEVCGLNSRCNAGECIETDFVCGTSQVADADSNAYNTVRIGDQCWMATNLNVGTYVASTDTGATHSDVTNNGIVEKYCYANNSANCATYGGLYDWNEAMGYSTTAGARGICPSGWHIPTDAEQHTLDSYLATGVCSPTRDGTWECDPAGTALKVGGSSDFEALLAGNRSYTGAFNNLSSYATFWSSSQSSATGAWRRALVSSSTTVGRGANFKSSGFSVRCLKD